jgi:hypothetical protein
MVLNGAIVTPVGMFWLGWFCAKEPRLDYGGLGCGHLYNGWLRVQSGVFAYLVDKVNAATRMLSYILGFAFPLFAPRTVRYFRIPMGYWSLSLCVDSDCFSGAVDPLALGPSAARER